jgi:hypothetical protein
MYNIASPRLSSFFAAAAMAAVATLLAEHKVPKAQLLLEHLKDADLYPFFTFVFIMALGLAIYRSVPGGVFSAFKRQEDLHHKAFAAYGPAAGALTGWIVVLSSLHLIQSGASGVALVLATWSLVALLVGVPIAAYIVACKVVPQYGEHGTRSAPRPMLVKTIAFMVFALGLSGVVGWYAA